MSNSPNLSVELAGIRLRNPLILTEGPLSANGELIRRAAQHELGAIVTKGIRPEKAISPNPYMAKAKHGLLNADWSDIGFERWCREIKELDVGVPLIASIAKNYITPSLAADFAEALAEAGVDMISMCDYKVEELVEAVRLARPRVKVPLMVKLVPFIPNIEDVLRNLERNGIDAIAAMDAVGPALQIDVETGEPALGSEDGSGYLSGAAIKPLALHYIFEISRLVDIPVVGVGGVTNYQDVLEMIMAGATGVGICSAALLNGLQVFDKIAADLKIFLEEKDIQDIGRLRSLTHERLRERKMLFGLTAVVDPQRCNNCGLCLRSCFKQAISMGERTIVIDDLLCEGCGLCMTVCNKEALKLLSVIES